ncbi:GAF domain-containing protein [Amnibacterium sp.]|uniref:sensor histidine kinase n=1 Tax=Amnibacterium sp. TaxID=1872496 RepID=UPI0026055D05|nr:GAF domain-containing protein [Amnibacterium sp.]MCU1473908.1 Two-component system histidine kinase [Amnibacterium sp.]
MSDPTLSFPDQPRVELDRRIADLVDAARDVLSTQGRLRALVRATHAITAQLELDAVLRTIVDSARDLTRADSTALEVLDPQGGVEQRIESGGERSAAHAQPGSDAGSRAGRSLTVPVQLRDAVFGNLHLWRDAGLSEEDDQLIRSLAATAAFAVEHARLYRETQRREEFAAASAEVTAALLAEHGDGALSLVADRVRSLLDADSVFVALLDGEGERLDVVAVGGEDPNGRRSTEVPLAGSLVERVLQKGEPSRFDETALRSLAIPRTEPYGAVMALPLDTADTAIGSILVTRSAGSRPFTEADLTVAGDFAARTSLALELHRARADQERMLLFEDRGRIARDLHDRVIQQLFATGMQLQGVLGTLPDGRNADRVDAAITSLDATIGQIRRIIFTLSTPERAGQAPTGRHRLLDLVGELGAALSVEPAVTFSGPVDALLDAELTADVLAVVGEGVTNAVKHGRAKGSPSRWRRRRRGSPSRSRATGARCPPRAGGVVSPTSRSAPRSTPVG